MADYTPGLIPSPSGSPDSRGTSVVDKYGNSSVATTIHASAAETVTYTSPDQDCAGWRRALVVCDLTALTGTSVQFVLEEKDPVSGKYIQMGASAVEAGAKTVAFVIDESAQSLTAATGQEFVLIHCFHSQIFRVRTIVVALTTMTFSIGAVSRPQ